MKTSRAHVLLRLSLLIIVSMTALFGWFATGTYSDLSSLLILGMLCLAGWSLYGLMRMMVRDQTG